MSGDIDLSELQLLPQWAKEPLQHNPYQNYEGETAAPRDRRGGRDDRGRGGPGRRPSGPSRPNDSRGRDSQRPPQNRGPRPDGGRGPGGPGPRSSDQRSSGPRRDQRDNRQGFRPNRDDRQERPPEVLPALEALFQPEPHGAESMVKQIKSSGRAYPVFELARMILKKPERHQVLLQVPANIPAETAPKLFVCVADQSLWLSEADAIDHLLKKQRDTFYQAEKVAIDPPKGNFTSIAVCGMSGAVLGPPNHHAYPAALRKLYLDRFSDMPFDAFKSRVRLVKDEAVLNQWKDQQSWKTEWVVKGTDPVAPAAPKVEVVEASQAAAEEIAQPDSPETSPTSEATETPENVEAVEISPETTAEVTPEAATEAAPETKPSEPAPADGAVRLPSLEAVRAHFIAEHSASQIKSVTSGILADMKARQQSDPVIQKIVRRAWDSEVRFPAKTGPALIHSLSKNGLQFFKWNKGITHVASVRPKRFDPAKSPVAEGVSKILAWVAAHPGKNRTDLLNALAPEAESQPPVPLAAAAPAVAEITPQTVPAEMPPTAKPIPAPEALASENSQPDASSVLSDLHWLLHEGYIVEFANNQLDLLRQLEKPAKPNPPTQPGPTDQSQPTEIAAESPAVQTNEASPPPESPAA